MKLIQRLSFAALLLVTVSTVQGQWTAVALGPAQSGFSFAYGSDGPYQVGSANEFFLGEVAGIWNSSSSSFVSLNPTGATSSRAFGAQGGFQVGESRIGGVEHASLWSGSSASFVNLNPTGSAGSVARATANGVQVGSAGFGAENHAAYWAGTSESFVNLNPTGVVGSAAYGTDGNQHVGAVVLPGGFGVPPLHTEAALWTGTSNSWVNLHQAGAFNSTAYAVQGGSQVGEVIFSTGKVASLWSGTAASWVNLHPTGATTSLANDVLDEYQVGMAVFGGSVGVTGNQIGGAAHAFLWQGSAGSGIDLHNYLPGWFTSTATGISYGPGGDLYISGYGLNASGGLEAFVLYGPEPVPEPGTIAVLAGAATLLTARRRVKK
jgi:hypothetical protein